MSTGVSVLNGRAPTIGSETPTASRKRLWAGRIISAVPALLLLSSGINMTRKAPFVLEGLAHLGYRDNLSIGIGITEFVCAALYLFPRTAFLGALLLTAYLGGATASHVRVGDPFIGPVLIGIVVWIGLILRDSRLSSYIFGTLNSTKK
jgi:hypothetical protein